MALNVTFTTEIQSYALVCVGAGFPEVNPAQLI